jgi:uncharacterized protein with PIN domain
MNSRPLEQLRWQLQQPSFRFSSDRCQLCRATLPLFISDELAGHDVDERYPETAEHLERCPDCLEEYVSLSSLATAALFG